MFIINEIEFLNWLKILPSSKRKINWKITWNKIIEIL